MKLEPLLSVAHLRASIEFYQKILSFELRDPYPNEEQPTYAPIFIGKYKLRLVQGGERIPMFHKDGICGSGIQLFIQVSDVDEVYERVRHQVEIVDALASKTWEDKEFTIIDPDGYLLSFYTPL